MHKPAGIHSEHSQDDTRSTQYLHDVGKTLCQVSYLTLQGNSEWPASAHTTESTGVEAYIYLMGFRANKPHDYFAKFECLKLRVIYCD